MRVIIAGSRSFPETKDGQLLLDEAIAESGFEVTEVVCGMARGADKAGRTWAKAHNVPVREMPADWDKFGKQAGYLRNQDMAEVADCAVICWDGVSKGSKHMIDIMDKLDKPCFVRKF